MNWYKKQFMAIIPSLLAYSIFHGCSSKFPDYEVVVDPKPGTFAKPTEITVTVENPDPEKEPVKFFYRVLTLDLAGNTAAADDSKEYTELKENEKIKVDKSSKVEIYAEKEDAKKPGLFSKKRKKKESNRFSDKYEIKLKVIYDGNSNTGGTVPTDSTTYQYGEKPKVLGNTGTLVRTGFTFNGWNTKADGSGTSYAADDTFAMGTEEVTLYAKWDHSVIYDGNSNTSGTVPTDAKIYLQGGTVTVLGNTGTLAKTGSLFSGWNTAANGTGTTYTEGQTFTMEALNVTLYAKWTQRVTYDGNSSTTGTVPTDSTVYMTGATVKVLGNTGTLTRTGYCYGGWNTKADGTGTTYTVDQTFAIGSANVTLYAKWDTCVYAAGYSLNSSNVQVPGYWKNGTWTALTPIDSSQHCNVNHIKVYGTSVYAAGYCIDSNGLRIPGYWLNGTWKALTPTVSTRSAEVRRIGLAGTDLYAAGYCLDNSACYTLCYWVNDTRTDLSLLDATKSSEIFDMVISGTDVYVTGYSGNSAGWSIPGYWKNGTFTALNATTSYSSEYGTALAVSGTDVYVAGYSPGSTYTPIYWLNGTRSSLTPYVSGQGCFPYGIGVTGSTVYIGGYCQNSNSVLTPGYWFNGTWTTLSMISESYDTVIYSSKMHSTGFYSAGYSKTSSGLKVPVYWKNATRTDLTPISSSKDAEVYYVEVTP
ncbi:MAG: InlB B-repeat-containing protein [Oligoflexales bacterium]|nr:InlB B-repeat-containing protein [Oligoflexales bacterium]